MSSSLKLFRNSARQTIVAAANRIAPHSNAVVRRNLVPALWARSFASGGFLPKEEVLERVTTVVKNFQNVDPAKVSPTSHFMNDLGLDSLDTVEIVMAFEDEFAIEIPDAEAEKIQTVEQAVAYLAAHPQVAPPPPMTQKRPDRIAGTLFSMRIVHSSLQRAAVTGVLID